MVSYGTGTPVANTATMDRILASLGRFDPSTLGRAAIVAPDRDAIVTGLSVHKPDLLVLDVADASFELAAELASPFHKGLPVVLVMDDNEADADAAGWALQADIIAILPPWPDQETMQDVLDTTRIRQRAAESTQPYLDELKLQSQRLAAAIAELAASRTSSEPALRPVDPTRIRAHIKARRLREKFFPADLFADPAWDMLLDLAASQLEGRRVSVSSLCIAAAVPTTTGLRWIKTMVDRRFLERHADPTDARRAFIAMTPETGEAMYACLEATLNFPGQ